MGVEMKPHGVRHIREPVNACLEAHRYPFIDGIVKGVHGLFGVFEPESLKPDIEAFRRTFQYSPRCVTIGDEGRSVDLDDGKVSEEDTGRYAEDKGLRGVETVM